MLAPVPPDEEQRLLVLRELRIVGSPRDAAFDPIVRLAAELARCPMAALSLVEASRVWFKCEVGLDRDELPREASLCAHVIVSSGVQAVKDARIDPRPEAAAMLSHLPQLRFHAAVPLLVDGYAVGALEVMDTEPRSADKRLLDALADLGSLASSLLLSRLIEQRTRLQEARVRTASRAGSDWLWETDAEGRVSWLSDSASTHLGDLARKHLGQHWSDCCRLHTGDERSWHRYIAATEQRAPFHELVVEYPSGDGVLLVSLSGVPVFDSALQFRGYRGAARDVTEELRLRDEALRTAEALAASEERWKFALEGGGQGVWDWDIATRQLYVAPGWRTLLGLPEDWQPNDPDEWPNSIHPDDAQSTRQRLIAHLRGETPVYVDEYRMQHHDGRYIWVVNRGQVVRRDAHGRALRMVGTLVDNSERRAAEAARRDKQAAEMASRAKSRFLSRMSHEMRTPLNAVLGFTQLLLDAPTASDPQRVRDYAQHVLRAGQHLLDLVDDVLDLQRAEDDRLELNLVPVDLAAVVSQAVTVIRPMAEQRGLLLHPEVPKGVSVEADEKRLLQVLINLSSNAVKYNRPAGMVRWSLEHAGGRATLIIEDTGGGFSDSQMARLFQPFERLGRETSSVEGTGLGLLVARKLTERMNGQLRVSSRAGIGTRLMLDLPLAEPQFMEPPPEQPEAEAAASTPALRLLYVEDNRVNALLFGEALRTLGAVELRVAEDGTEALELVREWQPDVLVLDAHLPGMTGYEVLAQLRALPGLEVAPAYMCSADALPEDLARARAAGFVGYWTKPIDIARVIADLEQLMATAR